MTPGIALYDKPDHYGIINNQLYYKYVHKPIILLLNHIVTRLEKRLCLCDRPEFYQICCQNW